MKIVEVVEADHNLLPSLTECAMAPLMDRAWPTGFAYFIEAADIGLARFRAGSAGILRLEERK